MNTMYINDSFIGQNNLKNKIDTLITNNKMPRYCIIQGVNGSGKKLMASYIAKKLNANYIPCGIKVDEVRNIINMAYEQSDKMLYVWSDCENMSINSKNAILKIVEEPPKQAYFVMTVDNVSNLLPTLVSRAYVFNMDNYSAKDINDYIEYKQYNIDDETKKILSQICITPKDVQYCMSIDIKQMYKLCDTLVNKLNTLNLANGLKLISNYIATKTDDDTKYNPFIFLRTFMMLCNRNNIENPTETITNIILTTSKALTDLSVKGVNRLSVLDNWLMASYKISRLS